MNRISGKGKVGFIAVFAVLLMPLLGIGTASAYEVGDQVNVLVPDLQEFPADPVLEQFTCRAITEHAIWLVQDISSVDNKGGFDDTTFVPKVVWGSDPEENLVDPDWFNNTLITTFESDVWSAVTSIAGTPVDIDGNGKMVIVLAAVPTKYNSSQTSQTSRNEMYVVDPEFFEIEGVAQEVCYINIHPYTVGVDEFTTADEMRLWNTPNALAYLSMVQSDPLEELWLIRGIAELAQHEVFGYTKTTIGENNAHGLFECLKNFRLSPYIELTSITAGNPKYGYAASRGQQFLWFMYLAQRLGDSVIQSIAMDTDHVGMQSIAYAIDPNYDEETAVNDLVVPIYFDWLVCNLHNDYRSDFANGIYKYDFLEGTEDEDWAHAGPGASAAFTLSFTSYPIEGKIAVPQFAMQGPVWAMQYCRFNDYTEDWQTYFNGQYSDGSGARPAINSRWEGVIVTCDDDAMEFQAVTPLTFDELYNTEFTLTGGDTYLIVTNNNPGGPTEMRYYISNIIDPPETETTVHQNSVMSQFVTVYTALVDEETNEPEGYDWIGPVFEASLGDSTVNIKMESFFGAIWTGVFSAWDSGTYQLSFAGYDSTGTYVQGLRDLAVGYADTDITLELDYASLYVPRGGAPTGAMITLAETDALGMALESSASIGTARGRMTGVLAGPVSIPDVNGTISFVSSTNEASVYRYAEQGWVKLDSWMQNGKVSASVDEGGIYALGEGIGVFAPEIPAQLVLGANAPNPFSAQTAISFGLPVDGSVRVNVFDMSGRLVNTLVNGEMAAANHTLVWDGTDMNGSTVGAGVYFCRLEAAGQVLTQKMLKVQ